MNEGERVIKTLQNNAIKIGRGAFVLTDQRLMRVDKSTFGASSSITAFNLENLDSVQVRNSSPVGCLVFGFLILAIGVAAALAGNAGKLFGEDNQQLPVIIAVGAVVLFLLALVSYLVGRRKEIQLLSGRASIHLQARPAMFGNVQQLVDSIQQAKQARLEQLRNLCRPSNAAGPSQSTVQRGSVEERLNRLLSLRRQGLLTEEEYKQERSRVLSEI